MTIARDSGLRLLTIRDRELIESVLDDDPVTNVFLDARLRPSLSAGRVNERLAAYTDVNGVTSLCWLGGNVVPTANANDEAAAAYAVMARRYGGWFSSLWGPLEPVRTMFEGLRDTLREPRAVRETQPFLVLRRAPLVEPDPHVRRVDMRDFDAYYAAAVAFFTEELGVSPERGSSAGYRALVSDIVRGGRAFARFDRSGRVIAKADVALVGSAAAQVQGVYVVPRRRGEGLAAPVVAAACQEGRTLAGTVTLYVNDFNLAARRAYARVGFEPHRLFRTYLW